MYNAYALEFARERGRSFARLWRRGAIERSQFLPTFSSLDGELPRTDYSTTLAPQRPRLGELELALCQLGRLGSLP